VARPAEIAESPGDESGGGVFGWGDGSVTESLHDHCEVVWAAVGVGVLDDTVLNPATVLGGNCRWQLDVQTQLSRQAANARDIRGRRDLQPGSRTRFRVFSLRSHVKLSSPLSMPVGIPSTSSEP
jgi:hypothetical protein